MLHTKEQTPAALGVETLAQLVADTPKIITDQDGRPLVALINYQLYLALQATIDEWYAGQRATAAAAYLAWKINPSRGRPWEEVKAELIAEGILDEQTDDRILEELEVIIESDRLSAQTEKDPSTLISHQELKRQLAEKQAHVAA